MTPDEPFTASPDEVRQLLQQLVSLKDKWPSESMLGNLSPRMANGLMAYNDSIDRIRPGLRIVLLLIFSFLLVGWAKTPGFPLYLVVAIPMLLFYMFRHDPVSDNRYIVYALTQADDVRVLSTLVKATDSEWGRHPEVLSAIGRLLPLVTEEHTGLLSPDVQGKLWYLAIPPVTLEAGGDEHLARGAVQALTRIGNGEMLNRMKRFVQSAAWYRAHRSIQEFMAQLIPYMEARLQQQQLPQTLLRASDASSAPPDTLLRATCTSTQEPPQQLLRASTAENSETEV